MIQANELRVGNWVLWNGAVDTVEDGQQIDELVFDPIPLTPEILEKIDWNGYVKLNIGSYFKIDDVGHLYYRSDYTGINIDYLHQLQNLYFALTGTELNYTP
jgi:hypothetical protein